jgi:integrase
VQISPALSRIDLYVLAEGNYVPRAINKLSVKFTERKDLKSGLYGDGGGLYLQVSAVGTKAWVYRFMMAGKARKMGLGTFPMIGLAEARRKAATAYSRVVDGHDPIEERRAKKAAAEAPKAEVKTFQQCASECIKALAPGWKSPKHAKQWEATLRTYAYPIIGRLPVGDVAESHVMEILQPVWNTKTETASRVRGRIEKVLDRAKALKLRTGENPARWKGHLDQLLPVKSQVAPVEHHPALPYRELPEFMKKLRKRQGVSARALEWTILTVARTGDTIGGRWVEIDAVEKLWSVPAPRLKGRRGARRADHIIPLPSVALTILDDLPRDGGEFVFPGGKEGRGLSNMAMAELLKEMGYPGDLATVHGFRSTFKDWASEQTWLTSSRTRSRQPIAAGICWKGAGCSWKIGRPIAAVAIRAS